MVFFAVVHLLPDRTTMADRSDPFDSIADAFDRVARLLETAARSWESTETDSSSSAAANAETASTSRQRVDLSTRASSAATTTAASTATSAAPSLDLVDDGDAFVVTVNVPGYETDDLEIRLSESTLAISGKRERERKRERSDTGTQSARREREVQSFSRQLALPAPVAEDAIEATVTNGVLTIRLSKRDPPDDATSIDIE